MASEKDPVKVQRELAEKNLNQSQKKLTFDPETGELIVKGPADYEKPGEVVIDQIYKDGFFVYGVLYA
jgi:hypothetical protein